MDMLPHSWTFAKITSTSPLLFVGRTSCKDEAQICLNPITEIHGGLRDHIVGPKSSGVCRLKR
jgi:hypothetical protein